MSGEPKTLRACDAKTWSFRGKQEPQRLRLADTGRPSFSFHATGQSRAAI